MSRYWQTEQYFKGHTFLVSEAVAYLVEAGTSLVGSDSHNINDPNDGSRPITKPALHAAPVKVKAFGIFPASARNSGSIII
jgi:kynurenine formamidase